MSFTITGTSILNLSYQAKANDVVAISSETVTTTSSTVQSYDTGTGEQKLNQYFRYRGSLTPGSGHVDFDLTLLTNRLSDVVGFTSVKEISIRNLESDTGADLTISSAPSNGWVAPFANSAWQKTIQPGGIFYDRAPYDGYPITSGSKNLRLTHSGGSSGAIDYEIILLGNH